MTNSGRFIDMHIIQTVPYANLNRDDTNSVKTVQYGGVERTRVSSQSWKRATRPVFEQKIGQHALRTRRFGERVARELAETHEWPAALAQRAGQHLTVGSGIKADEPKKNPESDEDRDWNNKAMVYIPNEAIQELTALAIEHRDRLESAKDNVKPKDSVFDTADIQHILRSRNAVINLYGRMLAEVDDAGVDGAVQVAHAFTTHGTHPEIDYFAAVDDITEAWSQVGSAHIGDAEFSAGTYYRYATIDVATLARNIGDDSAELRELITAFAQAFILSIPQAKRTATAPHTIPGLVHIAVRNDRPVSFAAGFEKPVETSGDKGFDATSQQTLAEYAHKLNKFLGKQGLIHSEHAAVDSEELPGLGKRTTSLPDLIEKAVEAALRSETSSK